MFSKFDIWQFREDANCWDYVREYYMDNLGIELPKFDIHPDDKKRMTEASIGVARDFVDCEPMHNAIACHMLFGTMYHVGVVDGNRVRHTSRKYGTMIEPIQIFERRAQKTRYKIHKSLWQN